MTNMHLRNIVSALLIAASAVVASPALGHDEKKHGTVSEEHTDFSAGVPGNPKEPARTIEVTMSRKGSAMFFRPDTVEVKVGEQIRFVLRNVDQVRDHEFVLATIAENLKHAEEMKRFPDMEHDDPNGKRLKSKETNELLWRFTRAGEFEFSCNIPGHREAGMVGKVIVK